MAADISSVLSIVTSLACFGLPRSYRGAATKPRGRARFATLSDRHDEQSRKPQQHLAVVAGRIGLGDACRVVGEKSLARAAIERINERSQPRALEPLHDPVLP